MKLALLRKKKVNPLEERALRFIKKGEELIDSDPRLGLRYLRQAEKSYEKLGYIPEIERKLHRACFKYATTHFKISFKISSLL